jgi:hypothetical protein
MDDRRLSALLREVTGMRLVLIHLLARQTYKNLKIISGIRAQMGPTSSVPPEVTWLNHLI